MHRPSPLLPWLLLACLVPSRAESRVVINEIFYHAPNDVEDLEYVELHNAGDQPVDLSGWKFSKGLKFRFPDGTRLEAGGFAVVCRDRQRFQQYYPVPVAGVFAQPLSNKGQRLELSDAQDRLIDRVKYQDTAPWPAGADGFSASLERICPTAEGDQASNWAGSPLSSDRVRPAGTPGRTNANYSAEPPPAILAVTCVPDAPRAGEPWQVTARLPESTRVREVNLHYRLAGPGFERPEQSLPMTAGSDGTFQATIPGQSADSLLRFRVEAVSSSGARRFFPADTDPIPALSRYVAPEIKAGTVPFAWLVHTTAPELEAAQHRIRSLARAGSNPAIFGGGRGSAADRFKASATGRAPFTSALISFDPGQGRCELFDFVQAAPHGVSQRVHLARGQNLHGMNALNLLFTANERSMLAAPLAFEAYRQAGLAAPQCYSVRLWEDGTPVGYQLLIEQPSMGFLRRHQLKEDGNLYRVHSSERGVVRQHEKRSHIQQGHEDILALVQALEKNRGDALWEVIRTHFALDEVVSYFALCTVLSDWDGFANNYLTYHDTKGTGRWTLYPWDQDQTWGIVGMAGPEEVLTTLPLSFGADGDQPPATNAVAPAPAPAPAPAAAAAAPEEAEGGDGPAWWRPGGVFSKPLLAHPEFRKLYLARVRELLQTVYTEAIWRPKLEELGRRLAPEVEYRAGLLKQEPAPARAGLSANLAGLQRHLEQRRQFLLAQPEIRAAASASPVGPAGAGAKPAAAIASPPSRSEKE